MENSSRITISRYQASNDAALSGKEHCSRGQNYWRNFVFSEVREYNFWCNIQVRCNMSCLITGFAVGWLHLLLPCSLSSVRCWKQESPIAMCCCGISCRALPTARISAAGPVKASDVLISAGISKEAVFPFSCYLRSSSVTLELKELLSARGPPLWLGGCFL